MHALIPNASLHCISSPHGHDSFLIEIKALNQAAVSWRDDWMRTQEQLLSMLRYSKWEGEGILEKQFSFRDARASQTFYVRLKDYMEMRVGREVAKISPVEGSRADESSLLVRLEGDLQVALAIDEIAADLQLQGKSWN